MIWSQLPGPDGWRSRRYGVSSVRRCQRTAPFVSRVSLKGHGAQPLWAGHCEMRTLDLSIARGCELPSLATSNAKMARKPRAAAQAWGSAIGTLGVSKRSRNRRRGGQAGRDARSWDLCRRQSRNSLIETSSIDLVRISPRFCFRISHRWSQCLNWPLSIHGCDLKHSGWLQFEGTLNPAKPSSRHGFATHGTHDSRPASGSFSDDCILRKTLISPIGNRNQRALLFECSQFETAAVVHLSRPANRSNRCERQVTGRLTRCVEAPDRRGCYSEAHQPCALPIIKSHIDWLCWSSSTANKQAPPKTPSSEKDWAHLLGTPEHKAALRRLCGQGRSGYSGAIQERILRAISGVSRNSARLPQEAVSLSGPGRGASSYLMSS